MGLLDSIKDIFVKKDIFEKIKGYAEEGNSGKLAKLVSEGNPMEIRLAAIDALKEIKMDDLGVKTLMGLLKDDTKEIVIAACNSLKRVGTKRELEELRFKAENSEDEEISKALTEAAVEAKERTPRF